MHRRTLLGAVVAGVVVFGTARAGGKPKAAGPKVVVHKDPYCGCCSLWVEHMRQAGFAVEVRDTDALDAVKARLGVPTGQQSCHTAEVGGYFVEGHIPATDVKRLLADKPKARGLALAGMPLGSPGMDQNVPASMVRPYTVHLIDLAGRAVAFSTH